MNMNDQCNLDANHPNALLLVAIRERVKIRRKNSKKSGKGLNYVPSDGTTNVKVIFIYIHKIKDKIQFGVLTYYSDNKNQSLEDSSSTSLDEEGGETQGKSYPAMGVPCVGPINPRIRLVCVRA